VEVPAPALVPLVEGGKAEGAEARAAVAEVCSHLPLDLDALVFGCTHYPVLESHFSAVLGSGIALVDPAVVQAERAAALLRERANGSGTTTYRTSGDEDVFRASVARIMKVPAA
jgi:glutamate racemase